MKAYSEYKDSGVPWLGMVPEHWEIHRGKRLFIKVERPVLPEDDVVTCFRDGIVTLRKKRRTTGFTESLKEIGYQGIRKGDLVIHQMDAFAGAVGVSDSDGKGTPVYSVCLPLNEKFIANYYANIIREMARSEYILSLAKGIRERSTDFRYDTFANQDLPVPSIEEQYHISRFLDYKTYQINKFIRAKKRMIELLKEQKQCIINDAVTGKIDVRTGKPYPKYKDSGVEWLGQVPEGWEVRKLKHISKMKSGDNITSLFIEEKGTYPVYGGNGIRGYCSDFTHDGEYVLIGRQGALCGNVHYVSERFWASEHAVVTKAIVSCSMMWLYYLLSVMNLNQYSESAAQPGISVEKIQNLRTIYPCYKEQVFINKYIDDRTKRITTTITNDEREISLMQEYRTRLIADVVTGKVDVRGIEVPDVPEEAETLEVNGNEEDLEDEVDSAEAAENE